MASKDRMVFYDKACFLFPGFFPELIGSAETAQTAADNHQIIDFAGVFGIIRNPVISSLHDIVEDIDDFFGIAGGGSVVANTAIPFPSSCLCKERSR